MVDFAKRVEMAVVTKRKEHRVTYMSRVGVHRWTTFCVEDVT